MEEAAVGEEESKDQILNFDNFYLSDIGTKRDLHSILHMPPKPLFLTRSPQDLYHRKSHTGISTFKQ